MATYNEKILERFADRLLARAGTIELLYALFGFGLGFAAAWLVGSFQRSQESGLFMMAVGSAGGVLGYVAGREKAFKLRFEAHLTLWRVQIERNTRPQAIAEHRT